MPRSMLSPDLRAKLLRFQVHRRRWTLSVPPRCKRVLNGLQCHLRRRLLRFSLKENPVKETSEMDTLQISDEDIHEVFPTFYVAIKKLLWLLIAVTVCQSRICSNLFDVCHVLRPAGSGVTTTSVERIDPSTPTADEGESPFDGVKLGKMLSLDLSIHTIHTVLVSFSVAVQLQELKRSNRVSAKDHPCGDRHRLCLHRSTSCRPPNFFYILRSLTKSYQVAGWSLIQSPV